MKSVSVADLKSRLSHYLRRVRKGGEVVITSHDHPVGKLVPYREESGLKVIPATRPLSDWKTIRGIKLDKPVDIVAMLREDRDKR